LWRSLITRTDKAGEIMAETRTRDTQDAVTELLAVLAGSRPNLPELTASQVHRIRVAIKQARAWLKLCRALSGRSEAYQQSVASLRTLSQVLSGQRDRDVALLTLDRLIHKSPGKKAGHCVAVLSQWIAAQRTSVPADNQIDNLIERLAQQLLPFVRLAIPGETQLAQIRHAYARMCEAADVALNSEACADLHAWRKRVKTLGYQLALVDCQLANRNKTLIRLNKLGKRLGEVHDLCVLHGMLEEALVQMQQAPDPAPVLNRIRRERRRLIESARKHHVRICTPDAPRFIEPQAPIL